MTTLLFLLKVSDYFTFRDVFAELVTITLKLINPEGSFTCSMRLCVTDMCVVICRWMGIGDSI